MTDNSHSPPLSPDSCQKWLAYVKRFEELYEFGRKCNTLHTSPKRELLPLNDKQHDIVICSPHPDDEALTGALPYRLMKNNTRVLNLAITLGSNPERKEIRKAELAASCRVLEFDCMSVEEPSAFAIAEFHKRKITSEHQIMVLADHFIREKPALVIFPHARDNHPTHRNTHLLALEALRLYSRNTDRKVLVAETEYWHNMPDPNLIVGVSACDVAALLAALACHQGEMKRNPYNLTLPARLIDNVRRGAEIIDNGRRMPSSIFAELYRLSWLCNGILKRVSRDIVVPPETSLTLRELMNWAGKAPNKTAPR